MGFYRHGTAVVEAQQFTDETKNQVFHFVRCNCFATFVDNTPALTIETPDGDRTAQFGDWVVKSGQGAFYPVPPERFLADYTPVTTNL